MLICRATGNAMHCRTGTTYPLRHRTAVYTDSRKEQVVGERALAGAAVPNRASDAYVRSVFDNFANSFDAQLAKLGYAAPALLAQAVAELVGSAQGDSRVADAGCGTGLCAPLLAPYACTLVGVDLSAAMLQKASRHGLYQELIDSDLVAFLDHVAGGLRPAGLGQHAVLLWPSRCLCRGARGTLAREPDALLQSS